jgi:hypothetical protein
MASFASGLAQGLQFGYDFGSKYGARKDIEELEELRKKGVIDNTEFADVSRETGLNKGGESEQARMLAAQDAEFGLQGDVSTTNALTENPNLTPEDYEFMGQSLSRAPNAFDKERIYQQELADVFGTRGLFSEQASASSRAAAAAGQSQNALRQQQAEKRAQNQFQLQLERSDREQEAHDSTLQTQHLQRTAAQLGIDLNTLKLDEVRDVAKINNLYFDYLGGNSDSLDPILEKAMPLYNRNKEDNHQLVKKKDGMYIQFDTKDGKPGETVRASVYFEQLPPERRSSLLEWSHRYAIAARTGKYKDLDSLRDSQMKADYYSRVGQSKLSDYEKKFANLDYNKPMLTDEQFFLTTGIDPMEQPEIAQAMVSAYRAKYRLHKNPPGSEEMPGGRTEDQGEIEGQTNILNSLGNFASGITKVTEVIPSAIEYGEESRAGNLTPMYGARVDAELRDPAIVQQRLEQIDEQLMNSGLMPDGQRKSLLRMRDMYLQAAEQHALRQRDLGRIPWMSQNQENYRRLSGQ